MDTTTEQPRQTVHLPARLAEAFQALRKGRHLCRTDGPVWFDLRDHGDQYRLIFTALGYDLSEHPRGFYYFSQGQQARPDVLSRIVYFLACFFADLDQGRFDTGRGRWVDTLINQDLDVDTLTQSMFAANDRQRVFDQFGVTREGFDKAVIAPLVRYGLASRPDSRRLRFRESIYRFVELFQACGAEEMPTAGDAAGAIEPPSAQTTDGDDESSEDSQ